MMTFMSREVDRHNNTVHVKPEMNQLEESVNEGLNVGELLKENEG
jgi:hypothetical protein